MKDYVAEVGRLFKDREDEETYGPESSLDRLFYKTYKRKFHLDVTWGPGALSIEAKELIAYIQMAGGFLLCLFQMKFQGCCKLCQC